MAEPEQPAGLPETLVTAEAPGEPAEVIDEATELDEEECFERVEPTVAQPPVDEAPGPRLSDADAAPGDILVIDDDDQPVAEVVQARQFRRLFSCLESGAAAGM